MATLTVDTDGGGDYTSLSAAEAALPATLTEPYTIECSGVAADTTAVSVSGIATSAINNLTINGEFSGFWDETKYRLADANINQSSKLTVDIDYVSLRGLSVRKTKSFYSSGNAIYIQGSAGLAVVERCYAEAEIDGLWGAHCITWSALGASTKEVKLFNNILARRGVGTGASNPISNVYIATGSDSCLIYNNVIVNSLLHGINIFDIASFGTAQMYNNIIVDSASDDYGGIRLTKFTRTNNISSDTTATGTNSLINQVAADLFTDPVNGDFTLKTGSNAIDAGVDLSSEFTTDIIGTTRTTPWDIGAYHFAGAADVTAPVLSSPTGTATGSSTADGSVSTDEGNGTLYYLASTNVSETAATIKAGSSQAVSTTGVQSVSFTGLTASTVYYAHYVQDDAASNESNVANSASFTTSAAGSYKLYDIYYRQLMAGNHV